MLLRNCKLAFEFYLCVRSHVQVTWNGVAAWDIGFLDFISVLFCYLRASSLLSRILFIINGMFFILIIITHANVIAQDLRISL